MDTKARARVVEGIEQAIQAETSGHHFYLMAGQSTTDPKGKQVFATLAEEELDHLRFLQNQKKSILETGMVDQKLQFGPQADLGGDHPIFSKDLVARIADAHFEMSALAIGTQLELNAQRYYSEQAQAAQQSDVRAFFERLASWEAGHYQALLRQQDSLKQDYWSAGGFAPF
jgi:rubrerythrin